MIPDVDSIWRGDEHSMISIKVKLADVILRHAGKNAIMDAYVQDVKTGLVIDGFSKSDLISFQFLKGGNAEQPSVAQVCSPRNNLSIKMHKTLFKAGDQFRVVVEMKDSSPNDEEILFGTSSVIA